MRFISSFSLKYIIILATGESMENLFNVQNLDIKDKVGNLTSEAKGKVKSTKHFPIFKIGKKDYIFKPLSKTKPYTTPLFAFSEVYWSYIVKNYFNPQTPLYKLAIYENMSNEQEKYYNKGTIVPSLVNEKQKLVNIYEYFLKHPEDNLNIANYVNYCEMFYDYKAILETKFLKENPQLGRAIAEQILLSILRADQNYHYENINLICEDGRITSVAPPIDYEFSTMFFCPDFLDKHISAIDNFYSSLVPITQAFLDIVPQELKNNIAQIQSANYKNLITICKLYPDLVSDFITKLEHLKQDILHLEIQDKDNFITKLNSYYFQVGQFRYKQNNEPAARKAEQELKLETIDKEKCFQEVIKETYYITNYLIYLLPKYQKLVALDIPDLESLTYEEVEKIINEKTNFKKVLFK